MTTKPIARPLSEWTQEDGDVLWWHFPIIEPPYLGHPLCLGQAIEIEFRSNRGEFIHQHFVGGWTEDYYTHWTPLPEYPDVPAPLADIPQGSA